MHMNLREVRKFHDAKELRSVHDRTCMAVDKLKSCEAELIACLQEVDRLLVHRFLGYNSLFQYSVHALKLSEAQSYAYIAVARKARELPKLQQAITSGELTVSKAVCVTSVINEENQDKWVALAMELPKRELEREVARENPRAVRPEQARFLDAHTLELITKLSEAGYKKLERVRELMASARAQWVSLETVIESLAEFYLERKDPVRRADRAKARRLKNQMAVSEAVPVDGEWMLGQTCSSLDSSLNPAPEATCVSSNKKFDASCVVDPTDPHQDRKECDINKGSHRISEPGTTQDILTKDESNTHAEPKSERVSARANRRQSKMTNTHKLTRKPVPASVTHQVYARDRGSCQATLPDGARCGSKVWIELHHQRARAEGGVDTVDNLLTLCRAHHHAWHAQP